MWKATNEESWTATRALFLDLDWAALHLAALRRAVEREELAAMDVHRSAVRAILVSHMSWESTATGEPGAVRVWHKAVHRALDEVGAAIQHWDANRIPAIGALEAMLHDYERSMESGPYRSLDEKLSRRSHALRSVARGLWRNRMATVHVPIRIAAVAA